MELLQVIINHMNEIEVCTYIGKSFSFHFIKYLLSKDDCNLSIYREILNYLALTSDCASGVKKRCQSFNKEI